MREPHLLIGRLYSSSWSLRRWRQGAVWFAEGGDLFVMYLYTALQLRSSLGCRARHVCEAQPP